MRPAIYGRAHFFLLLETPDFGDASPCSRMRLLV